MKGGCSQDSDGVVASPKGNLTALALAAAAQGALNVVDLNASLFAASGCTLDGTDCIVYARAAPPRGAPLATLVAGLVVALVIL